MGEINIIINMEKSVLLTSIVGIFILINIIILNVNIVAAAEPDTFNISITPYYYLNTEELKYLIPNQTYDGISFEITGINPHDYEIINISVLETNPKRFINLYNTSLGKRQEEVLGETDIIAIENLGDFNNFTFSALLIGIKENTNKTISAYSEIKFKGIKKEVLSKIGNLIWQGNSIGGLYILFFLIAVIIFITWKYQLFDSLGYFRRKSKFTK